MERIMHAAEDLKMPIEITIGDAIGVPAHIEHGTISGNIDPSDELALQEAVERHIVTVTDTTTSCCIDGRPCAHTMNGEPTEPRPSLAGGALISSYAAAELINWFGKDDGDVVSRMERVNRRLAENGVKSGGHIDEGAVASGFVDKVTGAPKTGCGADDKLPAIIANLYKCPEFIGANLQALLGEEYDPAALALVPAEEIANRLADWNPKSPLDIIGAEGHERVEVLQGSHAEIAVVFNFRENTTLDRDAFTAETGKQVFVVDMWYIDKLARKLAQGPDAKLQYQQLKHAMVAYQVATYVTLCDGTQHGVIVR